MSDAITNFFAAWQLESAQERHEKISSAVTTGVDYADPQTPQPINGIDALSEYVGMFSANAPGWTAQVVASSTIAGMTRATVAFGGTGPDGSQQVQLGQYFVEQEGAKITRMIGFVGIGEPS